MSNQNNTPLSQGNHAMRAGRYADAIAHYAQVLINTPALGKTISANLSIARQKYRNSRQGIEKQRVAVCCWELAHNPAGRAYTLARLYETFADVEIIGSIFPRFGREVWEPIRNTPIPKHSFLVEDESRFIDQAIALAAAHPYDIVHLSKPRAPNIFFGILYKLLWDAKVVMDIDDEELGFVGADSAISVDDYLKQHGQLPGLSDLAGKEWTRLAVGLADVFDGITVSNPALQQRYGGEIIRHARDEKKFRPSPDLKCKSREKFGIPKDTKVVLFFGTPRKHKGVVEIAEAIAELNRSDILFVIVGDFPDQSLKAAVQDVQGGHVRFLGNQPFDAIPEVVAIADCCVLLQDKGLASNLQVPAKLTDALAMGVPVVCNLVPALSDLHSDCITFINESSDVGAAILSCINSVSSGNSSGSLSSREFFEKNLSIHSQSTVLRTFCAVSSSCSDIPPAFQEILRTIPADGRLSQLVCVKAFKDTVARNHNADRGNTSLINSIDFGVGPYCGSVSGRVDIGVVILNRNGAALLSKLFESIDRNRPTLSFRIFITDHCSNDDSNSVISHWSRLLPIDSYFASENYSFSFSNNRWVEKLVGCEKILFLNNDIVFESNVIDRMAKVLDDPLVGIVGIDQWEPVSEDGSRQWHHRGIGFSWDTQFEFWRPFNVRSPRTENEPATRVVPAVTGSVMMVRRNDFLGMGGFDEGYVYGYEDVDLCLSYESKLRKRTVCVTSDDVIHADGVTRKKTPREELKSQRLGNIERLRTKFSSKVARMQRQQLTTAQSLSQTPPRVAFAVTEVGSNASAGDLFTAMELGRALESEFGWSISYRPRGDQWYALADVDIVVAMVDAYDPRRIKEAHPALIKIAWARNWFDRWCDHVWHDEYDLYFASSALSADYITKRIGLPAKILRIAANTERFSTSNRPLSARDDFVFTGSYWNAEREIVGALSQLPKTLNGAIYGKNWEKVPQLTNLTRGFVPYEQLPEIYRNAKIVIDDANHVTKPWGSVNSRVFDALAAGCLVVTNSSLASNDAFQGELPVYESPEQLKELLSKYSSDDMARQQLVCNLRNRVLAEHTYSHRAYEFRDHLRSHFSGSLRFAIKIPVPKREVAQEWGDYHFSESLAREFRAHGNRVRIDFLPDWGRGDAEGDDVTLVLRGLSEYQPRSGQLNLIWIISHPDKVSDTELNAYDRVFVASNSYAEELSLRLNVPVEALLQCTDAQRFNPRSHNSSCGLASDVLFVGNSRNQFRRIIKDALSVGLRPDIYGTRWEQFVSSELIKGQNVPNVELPGYYARATVVLNDHWDDMAKGGFVSNRLFDAVACGAQVISDRCVGMDSIFGSAVSTYDSATELVNLVEDARQRKCIGLQPRVVARVLNDHSFRSRAKQILSSLEII